MTFGYIVFGIFFVTFMLIVFRGAPYVPTKQRDIDTLLKKRRFSRGEIVVDLGSGDGRLLLAAAKQGICAVGYELNPLLAGLSWLRLYRYRHRAKVKVRDFWLSQMPPETAMVFVFLATPYMKKLDRKLTAHVTWHKKQLVLASYGMKIPGRVPDATDGPVFFYTYKP